MSSSYPPGGAPGPEYLEQGGGAPLPPKTRTRRTGGSRKPALIAGGAIAGLLLVGGGIWAATWYLSTGAQPAEALPDSTLGYVSIDLDPSGAQKIEALKMLNKFPAFKEEVGLNADDDIREKLFEEIQKSGGCADLDYGDDIAPWLGNRAAVAAVDTGKDQPTPVFVLQVKDEDKADAGLAKIQDCASGGNDGGGSSSGGWAIDGDWAVVAETDAIANQVADDAAEASLSDDSDYQRWTDEVGDPGIVNAYAAPAAGDYFAGNFAGLDSFFGSSGESYLCSASAAASPAASPGTPGTVTPSTSPETTCEESSSSSSADAPVPDEVTEAMQDFKGAAATIRFDDGGLELEVAGDPGINRPGLYDTDAGADVVSTLPADTAAALGVGFRDGWFAEMVDQIASYSGGDTSAAQVMSELAKETGLALPDDAETLAGDSATLALGSDFDPDTFFSSSDTGGVPIAAKIKGDPDAIEGVLEKLRAQASTDEANSLQSDSDGDMIAIGPDSDYRSQVLADGGLGDTALFRDVIPEADRSSALFFVNFGAGDGWLVKAFGDDGEFADNLRPLAGLGISAWEDGDAAHGLARLTTN